MVRTRLERRGVFGSFALCTFALACGSKTSSVDGTSKDASTATQSASATAASTDPIVDLLHTVDSTVAVSSKVDNPHDFPEHLVDGKAETAWNGKTGDLHGSILFRIPKVSTLTRVELTAGFDKKGPKGDLFTMNHRIKKVRLSQDGKSLYEGDLDVEKRGLQGFDVSAVKGGDFKLEILETVPGSEKAWKELTVSEFRVWGRTGGAPENPGHIPRTAIGSLDGVRPVPVVAKGEPPRGPFADLQELCTAYDKAIGPLIDARFRGDEYRESLVSRPFCNPKSVRFSNIDPTKIAIGPFSEARFIDAVDTEKENARLVLKTTKGFFLTPVVPAFRYVGDPGCLHMQNQMVEDARVEKTGTGQEVVVVRVVHRELAWGQLDEASNGATTSEEAYACRLDAGGGPSCEGPLGLGGAHEPFPAGWYPGDTSGFETIRLDKVPWKNRKKAVLGAAGDLRAE